ncbi:MAG TPA: SDR family oxidoreductase [Gemmatimonadaceae bacterium]|nr:SDR family oxidoreductase [Gemmatimonadaceae bacterium]
MSPAVRGPLAGRWAVVTGASRGIGAEVARRLAADGANVALVARSKDALGSLAKELGAEAIAVPCDLGDRTDVERASARILELAAGAPDIIVNNAGVFSIGAAHKTPVDLFRRTLEVNLAAPFDLVRAFLPGMRARGSGHLVTLGSVADRNIYPGNAAYSASKYGLRALHEVLRAELRGTGVRASLVSPGPVDTEIWDPIDPDNQPGFTPRARMLTSAEVADAIRWVLLAPDTVNVDELRLSRS